MELYEKKYKEALENMRKFRDALSNCEETDLWVLKKEIVKDIEYYFPELKESEDERIRKEIIEYIKTGTYHKDWIAWLEKQGGQNHAWSNGYSNGYIQAVEKAVEWLENHNDYIDVKDGNVTYFDMEKCVEDFRKYMKGGDE